MNTRKTIPLCDVRGQYEHIREEIDETVLSLLRSGLYIGGPTVKEFEDSFAAFCEVPYCTGVSSGTAALIHTLRALDVGPGDSVLLPAFTFIATAAAVRTVGAKPVFVDIDTETLCLDPDQTRKALREDTKVILAVHLFGLPADMDSLRETANKQKIKLIEDAAQAHGAEVHGKKVGSLGDVGCFSFFPSKNLGAAGDAGAIVTNDEQIALRIRKTSNHGRTDKYLHSEIGSNDRLDALQSAILKIKLAHLPNWNEERRQVAQWYREALDELPLILPSEPKGRDSVYHLYVVRTPKRDLVREALKQEGIETGLHYNPPLHLHPALADEGVTVGSFPISERAAKEVLSLPMYPDLKKEQVQFIATTIAKTLTL